MKILSRDQIREADAFTIKNEPVSSIDLMERAAEKCFIQLKNFLNKDSKIKLFCGKGNNGGDGLVLSRLLIENGYKIQVFILEHSEIGTEDFEINLNRLKNTNSDIIFSISNESQFPEINNTEIIIDALWGTGLTRPLSGLSKSLVLHLNSSQSPIFSIDMPSGTFCDSYNSDNGKIKAKRTFTFQNPKLAFFVPDNEIYIGDWHIVDIGLNQQFINNLETGYSLLDKSDIQELIKPRNKFDHKGKFGHALLIAGSHGKVGASVLSGKACIRSGAGLLTIFAPKCAYSILQTSIPEAMVLSDFDNEIITQVPRIEGFRAIGLGPGIGTNVKTCAMLSEFLFLCKVPLVLDADAINILSLNKQLLEKIPENTILTPHIGEFDRLVGKSENHFERLEKARHFSNKYKCILVLKGHYTAVICPNEEIHFNSTGNPGMAKGGSGDVLTGIILSMLSQGYSAFDAAKSAVYLHGMAGDIACEKHSEYAMTASDTICHLGDAFKFFCKC